MRPSEILEAARAEIEDPGRWCQGTMTTGRRYCAIGALRLKDNGSPWGLFTTHAGIRASELLEQAAGVVDTGAQNLGSTGVNDQMGHAATMEMYDVAISMALGEEAAS